MEIGKPRKIQLLGMKAIHLYKVIFIIGALLFSGLLPQSFARRSTTVHTEFVISPEVQDHQITEYWHHKKVKTYASALACFFPGLHHDFGHYIRTGVLLVKIRIKSYQENFVSHIPVILFAQLNPILASRKQPA